MNNKELKNKTISGFFWVLCQQLSTQLVSFSISMILARLLEPSEFGLVAMTSIFMSIAGIFVSSGLGSSLVQKKDVDHLDYNSVFYAGLGLAAIIYTILFLCAPLISGLYKEPLLTPIIRVMGLSFFFSSFNTIQAATITRELAFKKLFFRGLICTTLTGIIGISMAYMGFGVWALVTSSLAGSVINTIIMYYIVRWLPRLEFSLKRLKNLLGFGLNLMGTSLMGTFFDQLKGLIIGVKYTAADLAYYNRGEHMPSLISSNIVGAINGVLFPAIAKVQDDRDTVKRAIRRAIKTTSFFVFPAMFLLFFCADKIIIILFTEKWVPAIPFVQVICLKYCFQVIGTANLQALKAIGRADITFKLEFIKKPIFLTCIAIGAYFGPLAICLGNTIYDFIGATINAMPNKKLIGYSYRAQLFDVFPHLVSAIAMGSAVYSISLISVNIYLQLILQVSVGLGIYIGIAHILKFESYQYIVATAKEMLRRK